MLHFRLIVADCLFWLAFRAIPDGPRKYTLMQAFEWGVHHAKELDN